MIVAIFLIGIFMNAVAQDGPAPFSQRFQARQSPAGDPEYQKGLRALDTREWDDAVKHFDSSASHKGSTADAALYWKAYAQNRAGRREEALETISDLKQDYPSSRWIKDASALEVEMRAATGDPVNAGAYGDDDLKLLALNSLMTSDPDKALPILKRLLTSNNSPQLKDRAMFVLAQNPSPEARKLLSDMARNSSNHDLQLKAVRYMGMMGNQENRKELASIYSSSSDPGTKRAILEAFMISGSHDFLLAVAKTEKDPELRLEAIRKLALSGGGAQLWELYQTDNSPENRRAILHLMFMTGDSSKLAEIARSDKDEEARIVAIKSLGLMGGNGRSDLLVSIYRSDQNREIRSTVVKSLFLQQNAKALIELARNEKDPEMKKDIVGKLALIHSKEATDYMMELLR